MIDIMGRSEQFTTVGGEVIPERIVPASISIDGKRLAVVILAVLAVLAGRGLERIGESTGISDLAEPVFDQAPDAIQQDPPTPQPPSNGEGATSDSEGITGIVLGLAAFVAFLVFGNTILEELL